MDKGRAAEPAWDDPAEGGIDAGAVRALLERAAGILQDVADGITIQDASGRLVYANDAAARLIGFPSAVTLLRAAPDDILARFEMFDEAGRTFPPERLPGRLALRGGTSGQAVIRFRLRATGEDRWAIVSATPIRDEAGGSGFAVNVFRDITEQKRAEETLRQREARFRALIEQSSDAIALIDPTGTILYASASTRRVLGYQPDDLVGKDGFSLVHPDDRERVLAALGDLLARPAAVTTVEARARHANGSWRWLEAVGTNLLDEPSVQAVVVNFRDVTARRQAEEDLRRAEARYRGIFEHAVEGIFQTGFDGRLQAVNPAALRILGYDSAEELIAAVPDVRALYADPSQMDRYIQEMRTHGEVNNFDLQIRRKDGNLCWVSINARAIRGPDGRITHVEGMVTDITERKQLEETRERLLQGEREARAAAEAANRAKDEFLSVLSHELRTPLTPILGITGMLQRRGWYDQSTLGRALEIIERNARAQARLVADLLDMSAIAAGSLHLECRPVDLVAVVEAALAGIRTEAQAKEIALTARLDTTIGPVQGDAGRLQQVTWNLLSNAVKFTPAGGRIEVQLQGDGDEARIVVSDTGVGIAADFLPHVFDRFSQADTSTMRMHGGLGLGLALVRHLVEMHGGSVDAASPGVGYGATFTVRLPLAQTTSDHETAERERHG
jgi:PAS domain S-box-containing protein